ncbi:MAG: hypothetical protein R2726_05450 [Acidimicrobiales bacterium]
MSDAARAGPVVHVMAGVIAASGFASGDRVVVGHWWQSPIGPFTDVMWAEPDGVRVLYTPSDRVQRFVTSVYTFDRSEVVPFRTEGDGRALAVEAGDRRLTMRSGRGVPIPMRRPRWFTRWVEGPVARALLRVRVYGESPTGVQEWYQADVWRPMRSASAAVGGRDLGAGGPVEPATGFGFTEPPRRPSMVNLHTYLVDPSGRLDAVVGRTPR